MPPFTRISNTIRGILADADLEPTRVLRNFQPSRVLARQATATVTVVAGDTGDSGAETSRKSLSTGAIVGIVLGSVFGFLLLLWLLRSFSNLGAPPSQRQEAWYDDVSPDRYRRKKHHHHHHHHRGRDYSHPRRSGSQMRTVPVVVADRSSRSPRRPSATYSYERG